MRSILALMVLLALRPDAARADEAPPAPPPPAETPAPPPPDWKNPGERRVGEGLAAEFKVEPRQVYDLRAGGLGWGEVRHALTIAARSGKPLAEVLAARESGLGWGQVARKYGVKLGGRDEDPAERAGKAGEHAAGKAAEHAAGKAAEHGAAHAARGGPKH